MPRKKVSPDAEVIDGIAEIDGDEQLVEEVTRKVRRERVRRPTAEPDPVMADSDETEEDDARDFEDARPPFSETSLAALIYDDDFDHRFEDQFCTILVRRKPDKMRDQFATPCSTVMTYPALANVEITADRSDIEEQVRQLYGGGHYYFQIRFNNRLARSWETSLAELPTATTAKPETASPGPAPTQKDPLDSMLDNLAKMKQLRDALFGDERERLERQIDELKRQIDERPVTPPVQALPENLLILEKALATNNASLQEKLLDYAFPPDGGEHWIPTTLKTIFEHKDEIGAILRGLLVGPQPPQTPQAIDALLRGQPPAGTLRQPVIAPSQFQRRQIIRTADAEPGEQTNEFVNDVDGLNPGEEAGPILDGHEPND